MTTAEYTATLDAMIPMLRAEAESKPKVAEKINAGISAWEEIKFRGFNVTDMPGLPNESFGPILGPHYFALACALRRSL